VLSEIRKTVSTLLGLVLLAVTAVPALAVRIDDVGQEDAQRFVEDVLRNLGTESMSCPPGASRFLGPDMTTVCARIDLDARSFKKAWRAATKRRALSVGAASRTGWRKDGPVIERFYLVGYVSVGAAYHPGQKLLLMGRSKVQQCTEDWIAAAAEWTKLCGPAGAAERGDGVLSCPRKISRTNPDFPVDLASEYDYAKVVLTVRIGPDGSIDEVCLLEADPPRPEFVLPTLAATREWRYEPARRGGKPVESYMQTWTEFEVHR
jgi:hypothetical protein